jgi:outer membrane receptor protein involved in Fe transport
LTQVPWQSGTIGVRYSNPSLFNFLAQVRLEGLKYEDPDNMDKLRGFAVVDLSVAKPLPKIGILSKPKSGEIFLSVQNLFNHQYDTDTGGGILKIGTPFMIQGGVRFAF